jgi:hypothetical protein
MRIATLTPFVLLAALFGCGGGGGGTGETPTSPATAVTYQAVATAGELISYSVDSVALTYSYRIVESAYGKAGVTGNGKLTKNADGSYTPSGFDGKVAFLDNGLLLGTIYEDFNNDARKEAVPVVGISNPVTTLAEAVGVYNFISRQCGLSCENYYGTVRVNADGSWTSCVAGNLSSANPNCASSVTGAVSNFTDGRARISVNGANGGSLLFFKDNSSGQKVVILDLNGGSVLGRGAVFAASQALPASADGAWQYVHNDCAAGTVTVNGTTFVDTGRAANGAPYGPFNGSFTLNTPWNGFVRTANSAILMPTGSGMYAGYFPSGSISVGIRK